MVSAGEPEILHAITPRRGIARPLYHSTQIEMGLTMTQTRRDPWRAAHAGRATFLALGLAFGLCTVASAQSYPSKPIHIVVPFAPRGITDVIGRALGQRLAEAWSQQVVVENKPGGGTGQVGPDFF